MSAVAEAAVNSSPTQLFRSRLKFGKHVGVNPKTGKEEMYDAGSIISEPVDLAKYWPEKFEPADMRGPVGPHPMDQLPGEPQDAYVKRLEQMLNEVRLRGQPITSNPTTVNNPAATPPTRILPNNLDSMSLKELQAYAAEEEIDLKGARSRDDALKVIRASGN